MIMSIARNSLLNNPSRYTAGAYFLPKRDLFEYRIRKQYDKWLVICSHDEIIVCSSFLEAAIRGECLKNRGYIDGDR